MSYQERSITVSLASSTLILGYYLLNWLQMYQQVGLNSARIFSLWAAVIVVSIIANIFGNILANIVASIVYAIRTRTEESERFIEDERDRVIELRGLKYSYYTFSVGVLISMIAFVSGQPALIMFSLIVFFFFAAEIVGDIAQIILYRRGF
jgi:hypothetical protein